MKREIVLKVQLESRKARIKALKIIAGLEGVTSVSLDGDRATVVEEGLDVIMLVKLLRKKLGYVDLISVHSVGAPKNKEKGSTIPYQSVCLFENLEAEEKQEKNISKQDYQYKFPDTEGRPVKSHPERETEYINQGRPVKSRPERETEYISGLIRFHAGSLSTEESCLSVVLKKIEAFMMPEVMQQMEFIMPTSGPVFIELKGYMKEIEKIFFVIQTSMTGEQLANGVISEAWLNQMTKVVKDVEELIDWFAHLIGETKEQISSEVDDCNVDDVLIYVTEKLKQMSYVLQDLLELNQQSSLAVKEQSEWLEHGSQEDKYDTLSTVDVASQLPSFANMEVEGEMIGREEERRMLQEWLTDTFQNRAVITIYGIGGMGKTTLARKVYMDNSYLFECRAWVSVSTNHRIGDLLRKIKRLLGTEQETDVGNSASNYRRLVEEICSFLQKRRCLLVLDDMWDTDLLLLLNNAFSKSTNSRVIITTRRKYVASLADKNRVIYLQNLTDKAAQDLLFREITSVLLRPQDCPKGLLMLAEDFLYICGGWPLAIVSIASVLKNKIDEAEWTSFKTQLHMHMNSNPTLKRVVDAVSICFNDLPSHLKNCFLYCSIVPFIESKWITKLWAAEGFIGEKTNAEETMEEVAMQYIKELVNHCLLQVIDWNSNGGPKRLQMNEVVKVIVLNMAVKEKFGTVLTRDYCIELDCQIRRVSISDYEGNLRLAEDSQLLRSFVLFGCKGLAKSITDVLSSCRLLRVLCLRSTKITTLPSCVAELFNLHYLDLQNSEVREIPNSFEKLQHLEVLDLRCRSPVRLPLGLEKLHKLRHLLFEAHSEQYFLSDICALKHLQTLKSIVATEDIIQLVNLKQIKSLSVLVPGINEYARLLWDSLVQLNRLTSLEIVYEENALLANLGVLLNLTKLNFKGSIIWISPKFFNAFPKLNVLRMTGSELVIDPLPFFSGLCNLVELHLDNAYRGSNLTFRKDCFPKLKYLFLAEMKQPISIYIEEGTMRSLHTLQLYYIKQLMEVPKGLIYLKSLSKLVIWEVPQISEEKLEVVYRGALNLPKILLLSKEFLDLVLDPDPLHVC